MMSKGKLVCLIFTALPVWGYAQSGSTTLSLEECYMQLNREYPLNQQIDIQEDIAALNERIARSGNYPEIQLKAYTGYQSEVTDFPVSQPGITFPRLSQDQYRISVEISQSIYNGGKVKALRKLETGKGEVAQAGVRSKLWNVRRELEGVYFGILMLNKQKESLEVLLSDLEQQREKVQSSIENGLLLPGTVKSLDAEILNVRQRKINNMYDLRSAFKILSDLTGLQVDEGTDLLIPQPDGLEELDQPSLAFHSHPELKVFSARRHLLDLQNELNNSDRLPSLSAFGTSSYGRPGFDVFENDLHAYWIVGLRAQWSFKNFSNAGRKTKVLNLEKDLLFSEEQTYKLQLTKRLHQIGEEIHQLQDQIKVDRQILDLRSELVKEKSNQLAEGVITSTEYISELNKEHQARLNMEIHQIQLNQNKVAYLTNKGVIWN